MARLRDFLEAVAERERENISVEEVKEALKKVRQGEIRCEKIPRKVRQFLIQENILFYNPLEGTVRSQSRLLEKAIEEVVNDKFGRKKE